MTRIIKLTQGYEAIVDDEDYERLMEVKWQAAFRINGVVCARGRPLVDGNKAKAYLMHRFIINAPDDMIVDHVNHNPLDNRKCNLRLCNITQNQGNSLKRRTKTSSKYKGVSWLKANKKWTAHITTNGKPKHLGSYMKEEDAAIAYNEAAKKYFGEFAWLNGIAV